VTFQQSDQGKRQKGASVRREHVCTEQAESARSASRTISHQQQQRVSKGRSKRRCITEAALVVTQRNRLEAARRIDKP